MVQSTKTAQFRCSSTCYDPDTHQAKNKINQTPEAPLAA
jgi:hypothetical protein